MAINFGDMFDNVDRVVDPGFILVYEEGHEGLLRSLTVGQFKQQTNNLARSLLAIGCEPGDKVAIYMRNRLEYLVADATHNDGEIREMILNGRRAVWPKLCQIRNAVKVSQAIDEILAELE
ncbi:MAG: AMP-binding protein [Halieaceae bacterium]|jgi:acyl-coenzyme A synthetase/AMP-(fatty) acid ligase|nr:AMP-binding protein [Halieaceae bacterium]